METLHQLIEKAQALPEHLQEELLDFADFLIAKHGIDASETPLDEATQALLDARMAAFEQNRDQALPARDFLGQVKSKYPSS